MPGPAGRHLCSPSWLPDGVHVVDSRGTWKHSRDTVKLLSRIRSSEISGTTLLAASDPAGGGFATTTVNPDMSSTLLIVDEGKPARSIFDRKRAHARPAIVPRQPPDLYPESAASRPSLDFAIGGKKKAGRPHKRRSRGRHHQRRRNRLSASSPPAPTTMRRPPRLDGKHIVYCTAGPDGEGLRIMNSKD